MITVKKFELDQETIDLLIKQSDETLAQWWLTLNKWEWVSELGEPEEPPTKLGDGMFHIERTKRCALMKWIEETIGMRFILRVANSQMSDDEFEEFWKESEAFDAYMKLPETRQKTQDFFTDSLLNSEYIQ